MELKEDLRCVVAKMQHYDIIVSKFKLQSPYYVHFRTNILGKGMNPPAMGYKDEFGIK